MSVALVSVGPPDLTEANSEMSAGKLSQKMVDLPPCCKTGSGANTSSAASTSGLGSTSQDSKAVRQKAYHIGLADQTQVVLDQLSILQFGAGRGEEYYDLYVDKLDELESQQPEKWAAYVAGINHECQGMYV